MFSSSTPLSYLLKRLQSIQKKQHRYKRWKLPVKRLVVARFIQHGLPHREMHSTLEGWGVLGWQRKYDTQLLNSTPGEILQHWTYCTVRRKSTHWAMWGADRALPLQLSQACWLKFHLYYWLAVGLGEVLCVLCWNLITESTQHLLALPGVLG